MATGRPGLTFVWSRLSLQPGVMVSWDFAERIIDAASGACRGSLQDALEQPNATLSRECRVEVGRIMSRNPNVGKSKPRKGSTKAGVQGASKGSKHGESKADGTATVVLMFMSCILVAVLASACFLGGGRTLGGRPMRGGRRLHKKKQDRIRERGKKRR